MRTGAFLLAVVFAATGCRDSSTARRDAGRHPDASVVTGPSTRVLSTPVSPSRLLPPPVAIPMPSPKKFVLLDAGRSPRTPLRYRFGGAARELAATATITSKAYSDGAWTEAITLAPVRDGFGVTTDAGNSGAIHLRGLVAEVDTTRAVKGAVDEANRYLSRWRGLLERRRAEVMVDDRGQWVSVKLLDDLTGRAGDEARDELANRWFGLAVPLPKEPIGIGAAWRVVTLLRTGGAVLKQTATYRLTARHKDRGTIAVELERIGEHQDVDMPGLPADTHAELLALRRMVTGSLTIGPHDPLPLSGELTVDSASHARFAKGGKTHDYVTEDAATVALTSR